MRGLLPLLSAALGLVGLSSGVAIEKRASVDACPGYAATNIQKTDNTITADLNLGGAACNVYGTDLTDLKLLVEFQTGESSCNHTWSPTRRASQLTTSADTRLHVKIYDAAEQVYQVPVSVLPRPAASSAGTDKKSSELEFDFVHSPFSFSVKRKATGEVLFNTKGANIVFESQYLRLRTNLPPNPNLYGLGEHTDPFRLNTTDYTRTIWNSTFKIEST